MRGPNPSHALRKLLLVCGVLALVVYTAVDVTAALQYEGYSVTSQTISELSAVGAPTRTLWVVAGLLYSTAVVVCGAGVWSAAAGHRGLRIAAGLLVINGAIGFLWPFAPINQREVLAAGGWTTVDTVHIALAGLTALLSALTIGFGAGAIGVRFRVYSLVTLAAILVCGYLTGIDTPRVADNLSTPWVGITERIVVYGSMLWVAVLCILLIRRGDEKSAAEAPR